MARRPSIADFDFTGKTALVTGASRGIGRVLSKGLAHRGAFVVCTARSLDTSPGTGGTLRGTVEEIERDGGKAVAMPSSITDPEKVEAFVNQVLADVGPIDLLVNNAGVYPEAVISEMDPSQWDECFAVNFTAPFLFCRFILPSMIQRRSGRILNISSGAARRYSPGRIAYSAAKAGLERLTLNLAEEVREHRVAVNAWTPGVIATDMNNYMERGEPVEVVEESAMWLLAQDPARFTGQVVARAEFGKTWGPGR